MIKILGIARLPNRRANLLNNHLRNHNSLVSRQHNN
jgi:hypothetical protein